MVPSPNSHQPLLIDSLIHLSPFTASAKRRLLLLLVDGDGVEVSHVNDDGILDERCAVVSAATKGDGYSI